MSIRNQSAFVATMLILYSSSSLGALRGFDATRTILPPNYAGQSFKEVFREATLPAKDEFETTAEYEKRVRPLPVRLFAFRLTNPEITYDADSGELGIQPKSNSDGTLVLGSALVHKSHYLGTNAFGVKAEIERTIRLEYEIVDTQRPTMTPTSVYVPLPRRTARKIKDHVGILVLCLTGPDSFPGTASGINDDRFRSATGFDVQTPTIDSPVEVWTYTYALRAIVKGYWVYDIRNGEILGKFGSDGHPSESFDFDEEIQTLDEAAAMKKRLAALHLVVGGTATRQRALEQLTVGMPPDSVRITLGGDPNRQWVHDSYEDWIYTRIGVTVRFSEGSQLVTSIIPSAANP